MKDEPLGRVTATEKKPTSTSQVRFWVRENALIRPFDVVRIDHLARPGEAGPSQTYAIVQDLQYLTDSPGHLASFISHDFGDVDAEPQSRRLGTTVADAEVLYNSHEIEMPIRDGQIVRWADADGIREALGLNALRTPVPAGYLRMSNGEEVRIELEADYLVGPEGAHLNIAGISGLATKTSYAMFLLNSLHQSLGDKVTIVLFNVKGADLLAVDEDDPNLSEEQREEWARCGLAPQPFRNTRYLYPYYDRHCAPFTNSHAALQLLEKQYQLGTAQNFYYDVATALPRLSLLFSDIDDPNATLPSIIQDELQDVDAASWDAFRDHVKSHTQRGAGGSVNVQSWRRFHRLLRTRTTESIFTERTTFREKHQTTIRQAIKGLTPGTVLVVDIEPLPDYLQCFVVGDVLRTIYEIRLGDEEDVDPMALGTVVVFADELNKYAPRESTNARTLTQTLLEISERGRSLGVILFGAEQFRSGVHDRVLGNCGTNAFGRTSPVELRKCPDYHYFPDVYKSAISRLSQGTLLLQHAVFKTSLVKIHFPRPCYLQPKVR